MPTVVGEIRRYMRDKTWTVRRPRDLLERATRIQYTSDTMSIKLGRAPTANELGDELGLTVEGVLEVIQAREARDSRAPDRPISDEDDGATIADRIGSQDTGYDAVDDAITAELLTA